MANGSRAATTTMTVGLDLGDRYSYLCLLDPNSGEALEEGRLRTTPEALKRSFSAREPMRVAIEAGTHSPWASRLLEECGHEVLVANPRKLHLIYKGKHKTDKLDAENLARLARLDPKLLSPLKHRGETSQAHLALLRSREALIGVRTLSSSTTCAERSSPWAIVFPSALPRLSTRKHRRRYRES